MTTQWNRMLVAVLLFVTTASIAQTANNPLIEGTPYLNDNFQEGVIHYATRDFKVPLRYDAYRDMIEYQQNGRTMLLDPSTTTKKIDFGGTSYVVEKLNGKYGYFELLDSGKVLLLAKKKVVLFPGKKGGNLDGTDLPPKYKDPATDFYFKIGIGPLKEVESIKTLIASLPDKQEELTVYAKKEKISPRKEKEIVRFVQYYNSL